MKLPFNAALADSFCVPFPSESDPSALAAPGLRGRPLWKHLVCLYTSVEPVSSLLVRELGVDISIVELVRECSLGWRRRLKALSHPIEPSCSHWADVFKWSDIWENTGPWVSRSLWWRKSFVAYGQALAAWGLSVAGLLGTAGGPWTYRTVWEENSQRVGNVCTPAGGVGSSQIRWAAESICGRGNGVGRSMTALVRGPQSMRFKEAWSSGHNFTSRSSFCRNLCFLHNYKQLYKQYKYLQNNFLEVMYIQSNICYMYKIYSV